MKTRILSDNFKPALSFLKRFHAIIFFLIVSACLFIAIFLLLPITNLSTNNSPATGQTIDDSFDQATIDRLRGGASTNVPQPSERASPFVE